MKILQSWGTLIVASAALLVSLGTAAAFGLHFLGQSEVQPTVVATPALPASAQPASAPAPAFIDASAVPEITARVVEGVVNIHAVAVRRSPHPSAPDPFHPFFGVPPVRETQSLGSGVIVSKEGLVLTNSHVIEGASSILLTLSDGRDVGAELVGADPKTDLALLRIKEAPSDLKPLSLGDSNHLRQGQVVLAIGNPFGVGQTVTMGIVSATGRANMGIVDYEDFIQTDASINPGNSGGALVDLNGNLVGINTAILSRTGGSQGIGFAVPAKMVGPIMKSLLEHGRVIRGWLGVNIADVDAEAAKQLGLTSNEGALITGLARGGPAAASGIHAGDVILSVDAEPIVDALRLRNLVALKGSGVAVRVRLWRDNETLETVVTLGELPES